MRFTNFTIFLLIITLHSCFHSQTRSGASIPINPVALFKAGDSDYSCFRIPAIVQSKKGTLLAFCEGRKKGCSDTGDIDLVLRKSDDHGKSWGPIQVIWDAGDNVAGNPAPVVDLITGRIFLLCTWNLGTDHESAIISGTSQDTRRIFVLSSEDDGNSWSGAKEITDEVKAENWTWYATGPVHGIQIQSKPFKNRLIIPCDHIEKDTRRYYSHVIYSDDHGDSWNLGGSTPQDQVNECTVAELSDGRLMLNMRNYDRSQKNRKISFSQDGGESWSDIQGDPQLIEPICQASLLTLKKRNRIGEGVLLFLNPSDSVSRKNMTLQWSEDAGTNWKHLATIHPGPSAYSDVVQINKSSIACFYEAGEASPYEAIYFKVIELEKN